jgi:catechol 2,3-dioxygenase-like lactoylglutathione lyase family enzyme
MHRMMMAVALLALLAGTTTAGESPFTEGTIHVGVVVTDLDKSTAFYTDVLGMTKTGQFDVSADFGKASGLTGGLAFHVDVFGLRNEPGAAQFKLMSFEKDARTPRSAHIQDSLGMQYVTLNVTDLTPFVARIKAAGVPLLGDTPVPLFDTGKDFVLVQDPDGTFIELIGPMK